MRASYIHSCICCYVQMGIYKDKQNPTEQLWPGPTDHVETLEKKLCTIYCKCSLCLCIMVIPIRYCMIIEKKYYVLLKINDCTPGNLGLLYMCACVSFSNTSGRSFKSPFNTVTNLTIPENWQFGNVTLYNPHEVSLSLTMLTTNCTLLFHNGNNGTWQFLVLFMTTISLGLWST